MEDVSTGCYFAGRERRQWAFHCDECVARHLVGIGCCAGPCDGIRHGAIFVAHRPILVGFSR